MSSGGKSWVHQFRSAINLVIGAIYWIGVREYIPRLRVLENEKASTKSSRLSLFAGFFKRL
jgi:hypothetical protein